MADARETLLDKAMAHVAAHGIGDTSLRELAAGMGTSHRMLIYHFGSREGLVAAIVARMERQQREALVALAADAPSPAELIRRQWAALTDPAVRPFVALFFEVTALGFRRHPGTEEFLAQLTAPWIALGSQLGQRYGLASTPEDVHIGIAAVRGLLIDVLASGDPVPATATLERFLARFTELMPS